MRLSIGKMDANALLSSILGKIAWTNPRPLWSNLYSLLSSHSNLSSPLLSHEGFKYVIRVCDFVNEVIHSSWWKKNLGLWDRFVKHLEKRKKKQKKTKFCLPREKLLILTPIFASMVVGIFWIGDIRIVWSLSLQNGKGKSITNFTPNFAPFILCATTSSSCLL